MAFDYAIIRDSVVNPLLTEFGTVGTLYIPGVSTGRGYDPQPGTDTTVSITLVATSFSKEEQASGNVQITDSAFIVSTKGVTADPSLADRLQAGGVIYQIVGIKPLQPGDTLMLWKIHARK